MDIDKLAPILNRDKLEKLSPEELRSLAFKQNLQLRTLLDAIETMDYSGKRAEYFKEPKPEFPVGIVEDGPIRELCERYGYGAVMDSAARQWFLKDPNGAFVVGPCAGTLRLALEFVSGERKLPYRLSRDWDVGEDYMDTPKRNFLSFLDEDKLFSHDDIDPAISEAIKEVQEGKRVVLICRTIDIMQRTAIKIASTDLIHLADIRVYCSELTPEERNEALENGKIVVATISIINQGIDPSKFDKVIPCMTRTSALTLLILNFNKRKAIIEKSIKDKQHNQDDTQMEPPLDVDKITLEKSKETISPQQHPFDYHNLSQDVIQERVDEVIKEFQEGKRILVVVYNVTMMTKISLALTLRTELSYDDVECLSSRDTPEERSRMVKNTRILIATSPILMSGYDLSGFDVLIPFMYESNSFIRLSANYAAQRRRKLEQESN